MNKALAITLGIVTSVGGSLDVAALATAAQAGAAFGFQLGWAVVLGTICLVFLVEQAGRLAAASRHTIADAMRDRFGFGFFLVVLVAVGIVTLLVLAAEIGGVCLALQLVSGVTFQWWALPVAFGIWLVLWKGTFGVIENGVSLLGLVTLVFLAGAARLQPAVTELGAGLLPSLPSHDHAHYWFLAVIILGASISPYLFYFYSAGAVENRWGVEHLRINRVVASLGMAFGGLLALAVLAAAAVVFEPRGVRIERFEQVPLMLIEPLGYPGFVLFVASLGVASLGAALEVALALAYMTAQGFGWNWGQDKPPREAARFVLVYTVMLALSTLPVLIGIDPMTLTIFSMAVTALSLPLVTAPFLVLMNDAHYVGAHRNGWISNGVVAAIVCLAFVLAAVTIPLEILGSH